MSKFNRKLLSASIACGMVVASGAMAGTEVLGKSKGTSVGYINGNTFAQKEVTYSEVNGLAVFEGDIILGTIAALNASTSGTENGVIIPGNQFRWTGATMPYQFQAGLSQTTIDRVNAAIAHWTQNTPVRFVQRTSANSAQLPDYVEFRNSTGCSSFVGKQSGAQPIFLSTACSTGNTIHEIGHAFGLWHEQSREDRNSFVRINWANITAGQEHNFDQHITDGDDVGTYDYGSIMHYPRNAFSSNGQPTIEPTNPATATIGLRTELSQGDIQAIRSIYPSITATKWHDWFAPNNEVPAVGDFNGDGRDDIVTFTHDANGDVYVALSNGAKFGSGIKWHDWFSPSGEIPLTGDFNGDGRDDIVTFSSDANGDVYVALSNGSSFGGGVKWHDWFAPNNEIPLVGDFNGDGRDDIVTFTSDANGDVYVALSNGSSFGGGVKWHDWFAPNDEVPVVADVNGDGLDDIITFTSDASGDVYVAYSNGSSFGNSVKVHDWFAPNDEIPSAGDFNNDGRSDIITFTSDANGDVYVGLTP